MAVESASMRHRIEALFLHGHCHSASFAAGEVDGGGALRGLANAQNRHVIIGVEDGVTLIAGRQIANERNAMRVGTSKPSAALPTANTRP